MNWEEKFKGIRDVLGKDVIFPYEVEKVTELEYGKKEKFLAERLVTDENIQTLLARSCQDKGLILFPGPPKWLNVLQIENLFSLNKGGWQELHYFAHLDNALPGWYAVDRVPSDPQVWSEYVSSLHFNQRIPNAPETIWFLLLYEKIRGKKIIEDTIQTSSWEDDGWRVCIDTQNNIELFTSPSEAKVSRISIQEIILLKEE